MDLKIIVIILVVLGSLYSLVLSIVNMRSSNNKTPENLSDVYDTETYEKWKKYSGEHSKLKICSTVIGLVVTVVMLAINAHFAFATLFPASRNWQIFAVVLLEVLIGLVAETIESYISNMIIEQKYGFNRTSIKTFIGDVIRQTLLSFILSMAIAFLIAFSYEGINAWMILVFVAVAFAFSLLITFLYPYLSRIGNKFTPLEDGELKDKLMALLSKYGYKVKAIEVMEASKRTTKLNAYFTGFGKLKTIVLYDNLLNQMSTGEICAVFAHEMGHGLNKDVLKNQILSVSQLTCIALLAYFAVTLKGVYLQFGFSGINYGFTYILIGIGLSVIQPLFSLISNARSRKAEYLADNQAVLEGYGEEMISAFKKLAKNNFSNLAPSKLNVVLQYSHPPLSERVANVEKQLKNN